MKPKSTLRSYLALAGSSLLAISSASAATFYWDVNGTTASTATPSGTWISAGTAIWSTDANGLTATSAVTTALTDDLVFSSGTASTGAYTITLTTAQNAQSLTFEEGTATISGAGGVITLGGTGNIRVNSGAAAIIGNNTTTVIGGTAGLTKLGAGTLTLNGALTNTFTGGINVNLGTLALDYANIAASTNLVTSQALSFGGGNLTLKGNSTGLTTQTLGNVTVNSGSSTLLIDPNNGTSTTLTLGSLTATAAGGSLTLGKAVTANTGTVAITTTTDKDATDIYGGRIVFADGTANTGYDWTTNTGGGGPAYTLSAYSGYSVMSDGTGGVTDTSNSRITATQTQAGNLTTNSLKIENPAASQSLALGSNLMTLTSGGLLVTGTNAVQITGTAGATRLTAGNGSGAYELIIHQYNSGGLTIGAVIGDNGGNATSLTKAGTGALTLSGSNTFTGGVNINTGNLILGNVGALNSTVGSENSVTVAPSSTLTLNGNSVVISNLTGGVAAVVQNNLAGTATLTVGNSNNSSGTYAGVLQNGAAGTLALTKNGTGTLTLTGGNTYTGATTINAGTLQLGNGVATGSISSSSIIGGAGSLVLTGGGLTLNTLNSFSGGFTLNSGTVSGITAGYGGFGSGTLTVTGGSMTASSSTAATIGNELNWGGSILFNRAGGSSGTPTFTFTGGLTLSNNLAITLGISTTAGAAAFTNNISGAFGINVVSGGPAAGNLNALTLSGANNTFSGGLSLGTGSSRPMFLYINSATALGATAGTFTIAGSQTITIDNTAAAAITLANNNPLAFNNGFTFTGTRDLNMGTGAVNLGTGTRTLTINGGILTLGGVISNGGITKAGAGTLVLSGANSYASATTVSAGTLVAGSNALSGVNGAFGNASSDVALGTLSGNSDASILTGGAFTIGRIIRNATANTTDAGTRVLTLGGNTAHNSVFSGNIFLGTTSQTSKGIQLTAAAGGQVTFSGVIQNPSGQDAGEIASAAALTAVTKVGLGTVVLSNTNTYTGATAVNEGTLALGNLASINASANISIAAGTTFDVSQQTSPYTLSASNTLSASGTGTTAGSTAARIVGPLAGVVSLGAQTVTLTWAGDTSGTDTDSPPLHVSQGALTLNNNAITINGSTLGLGTYRLIQVGDGATGTLNENVTPSYAVSGTAIDGTKTNVISSDGSGNIILTVTGVGGITFADWKNTNGAGVETLADDHDGDGVDNGTEYFLFGSGSSTGFTALPGVTNTLGTLSVTWTKAASYAGTYGTDFRVETSDTLTGTWTQEDVPPTPGATVTISGNNVTYTFPGGPAYSGKKFARLKVTGP